MPIALKLKQQRASLTVQRIELAGCSGQSGARRIASRNSFIRLRHKSSAYKVVSAIHSPAVTMHNVRALGLTGDIETQPKRTREKTAGEAIMLE